MTLSFGRDGSLDLAGKVVHPQLQSFQPLLPDDLDGEQLLGHHLLVFP